MTAELVAFQRPPTKSDQKALLAAVRELHALITIDPVLGASPVRVYFALSSQATVQVIACLCRGTAAGIGDGYALVAYDFPFALHQFELSASQLPRERAQAIIACSSAFQEDSLRRAAGALGIDACPVANFDADRLKATFFLSTQEAVTHVFRLALA